MQITNVFLPIAKHAVRGRDTLAKILKMLGIMGKIVNLQNMRI